MKQSIEATSIKLESNTGAANLRTNFEVIHLKISKATSYFKSNNFKCWLGWTFSTTLKELNEKNH